MTTDIRDRNNIKITGEGERTLVFAHGFGCDQTMWRYVAPQFERDYRVVMFDYVGSGRSDHRAYREDRYSSLSGYAQDVLEIAEDLKLRDAIFVGHSVSGMIGALASIERQELFSRLIMIGSSPRYLNDLPEYYGGFDESDIRGLLGMMEMNFMGWANYLAPIVLNNPNRSDLSNELEHSFSSSEPKITRQFAEATFFVDCREQLGRVTVPSLILQCAEDSIAPKEVGDYLHAHLNSSRLSPMQAKGHYPHLSHPEETTRLIKEYLAS